MAGFTSVSTASATDVLYLQQPGNATAININDINQRELGDCFLMAPIGELALYDPNAIMNMIHGNANGTETVTLYTNSNGSLLDLQSTASSATFRAVSVTVDNTFPTDAVNNDQPSINGQTEIWVQVLEKAVATLYAPAGGPTTNYALLNDGGFSIDAMELLTGRAATRMAAPMITATQPSSDLASGDLITVETSPGASRALDLISNHAYAFEGITMVNGTAMVQLYNPWGLGYYTSQNGMYYEADPSTPGALPNQPSLISLNSLLSYLDTPVDGDVGAISVAPPPLTPPTPTVSLHGSSSQYVIADDDGTLCIQDKVAGRDGTQVLPGVDTVQFTNGTGVFDPTGTSEDVARLYGAALDRAPDLAGLQEWTADIDDFHVPLSAVAYRFATSPEFIQDYGQLSDAAFVNQLYHNVLNRAPDAAGAQDWKNALAGGMPRGSVLMGFAESQEYKANTLSVAGDNDNGEVYRLYGAAFNRTPDPAGQASWSAGLAAGEPVTQVAQGFVGSVEFQQDYGNLSISSFLTVLYQNVLHRAPDGAGLQAWTSALRGGASEASVIVGFSDSLEYRADTSAATHANWVFIPS